MVLLLCTLACLETLMVLFCLLCAVEQTRSILPVAKAVVPDLCDQILASIAVWSGRTNAISGSNLKQCVGGICCDNGRFQTPHTICRAKRNECDLAELCSGILNLCPYDKLAKNGYPCQGRKGRCLKGKCVPFAIGNEVNYDEKRSIVSSDGDSRGFQVAVEYARGRGKASAMQPRLRHRQKIEGHGDSKADSQPELNKESRRSRHHQKIEGHVDSKTGSQPKSNKESLTMQPRLRQRQKIHGQGNSMAASQPESNKESPILLIVLCSVVGFAVICASVWVWYTRRCCCLEDNYDVTYEPLDMIERDFSRIGDTAVNIDVGQH